MVFASLVPLNRIPDTVAAFSKDEGLVVFFENYFRGTAFCKNAPYKLSLEAKGEQAEYLA